MRILLVHAALSLALLLTSCHSAQRSPDATTEPSPTPVASPGGGQTSVKSSRPALQACDPALQEKALRPNLVPDWDGLGVNTCYELEFDLTPGDGNYTGRATITFTNPGSTELEEVMLRVFPNAQVIFGGSLEITSARANGAALTPELMPADETTVRLPLETPLEPGDTVELALEFNGRLPVDFESGYIYGTFHLSTEGPVMLLSNGYPMLALLQDGEWQISPVLAEGDPVTSPIALYRAAVTAPAGWQVAASGVETTREADESRVTIEFAGGPMRDFMLAASPAFILTEAQGDGIHIRFWGLPSTRAFWDSTLETTQNSLRLFNQTFGELPYTELDIVITPLQHASGVEYPGLILLGEKLFIDPESNYLLPMVTAHEVAHQWWYAVIGNDVLDHPWQDESLATYSAQFYALRFNETFYEGARLNYLQRVENYEASNGTQAVGQPVMNFSGNPMGYTTVVYTKGDLFFESLRSIIGEKDFDAALKQYYAENIYQIAAPEDLLDSFEAACACSLDDVYAEWGVAP